MSEKAPSKETREISSGQSFIESLRQLAKPVSRIVNKVVRPAVFSVSTLLATSSPVFATGCTTIQGEENERLGQVSQPLITEGYDAPVKLPVVINKVGSDQGAPFPVDDGSGHWALYYGSNEAGGLNQVDQYKVVINKTDLQVLGPNPAVVLGANNIYGDDQLQIYGTQSYLLSNKDQTSDKLYNCSTDGSSLTSCLPVAGINNDIANIYSFAVNKPAGKVVAATNLFTTHAEPLIATEGVWAWTKMTTCNDPTYDVGIDYVDDVNFVYDIQTAKGKKIMYRPLNVAGTDCDPAGTPQKIDYATGSAQINVDGKDQIGVYIVPEGIFYSSNQDDYPYFDIFFARQKAGTGGTGGAGGTGGTGGVAGTGGIGGTGGVGGTGGIGGTGGVPDGGAGTGGTGGVGAGGTGGVPDGGAGTGGIGGAGGAGGAATIDGGSPEAAADSGGLDGGAAGASGSGGTTGVDAAGGAAGNAGAGGIDAAGGSAGAAGKGGTAGAAGTGLDSGIACRVTPGTTAFTTETCDIKCDPTNGQVTITYRGNGNCPFHATDEFGSIDVTLTTPPGSGGKNFNAVIGSNNEIGIPETVDFSFKNSHSKYSFQSNTIGLAIFGTQAKVDNRQPPPSDSMDKSHSYTKVCFSEGFGTLSLNHVPAQGLPNGIIKAPGDGGENCVTVDRNTNELVGSNFLGSDAGLPEIKPTPAEGKGCGCSTVGEGVGDTRMALVSMLGFIGIVALRRRKNQKEI